MDKIKNAIIIHGPGKSGTTLLYQLLSMHKELCWLSGYNDRYPNWSNIIGIVNRLGNIPNQNIFRKYRVWPKPAEAYKFWEYYFQGFREGSYTKIENQDIENCKKEINTLLRRQKKNRILIKITGLARASIIEKIFKNPKIIYIDRDPRAVIMSYYKARWLYKDSKIVEDNLSKMEILNNYLNLYKLFYQSKNNLKIFDFLQVKYEKIIESPELFFHNLIGKLNLSDDKLFFDYIIKNQIFNQKTNLLWKKDLNKEQKFLLNDKLKNQINEWEKID